MTTHFDEDAIADSLTGMTHDHLSARERILLWVASGRFGFDELESFEFILPEPAQISVADHSIDVDGLLVHADESGHELVLLLYRTPLSPPSIADDIATLQSLGRAASILRVIARQVPEISAILARSKVAPSDDDIHLSIATVAPGFRVKRTAGDETSGVEIEVLDERALEVLRNAISEPGPVPGEIFVAANRDELIETTAGKYRIVIGVVRAIEALKWPEIESRRLFDLNVRLGLGRNRVRRSLDEAFSTGGQEDILAYHNGMTVLTNNLTLDDDGIRLNGISVVNGAQTLLALQENRATVSPDLRLVIKFVEIKNALDDAQEIAVRSNSQNPVTTRNLRALDLTQLRLRRELIALGFELETRPSRGHVETSWKILQNDALAQWLCAIYLAEPWLAVKRTSLFLQENYSRVFPVDLDVARVVFAARIRRAVDVKKSEFPVAYHRAWSLTALTACYLVGQLLRSSREEAYLLLHSSVSEQESVEALGMLDRVVDGVIDVMRQRDDQGTEFNNYYVDFKSKQALLRLSADATRLWSATGGDR